LQSDINVDGKATELLVKIVRHCCADVYLCGGGATQYQQDELFEQAAIGLLYQNYKEPTYCNIEDFIPGLSIIHYLMWSGEPYSRWHG